MDLPWEMHRAAIRNLYLGKDMTIKEVMDEMERTNQFKATAGQYERQFKKWGFRKNLTAEQWQFVSRRVEKRKRDGKDTDVKIDGVHVPEKKLAKAIARYGQGSTLKRIERQWNRGNASRSPTPEGIGIVTPAVSPLPSLEFTSPQWVELSPLPWFDFSSLPSFEFSPLPWLEFREMISSHLRAQPGAFRDLEAIDTCGSSVMHRRFTKAVLPSVPSLEPTPETQDGPGFDLFMLEAFMASNHISADWKTSITSMGLSRSPRHLGLKPLPWNFIDRLQSPANLQILKRFSSSKYEPTIEALYEVLFKEALESRNVALVEILLSCSKIDVNEFLPGGFSELPIQMAVRSMDAPMIRLLLGRGAKPTSIRKADLDRVLSEPSRKPIELPSTSQWSRIELSHRAYETPMPKVPRKPESKRLAEAAESGLTDLVEALLDDGADVNAPNMFGLTPLQLAVNADLESLQTVDLLLKAGADVHRRSYHKTFLSPTPLQIAIFKRRFHVAELLVRAGADVNAEPARFSAESIDIYEHTHFPLDLDGHSALDIALYCTGDRQCAGLLLRNNAISDDCVLARLYQWDERDMIRQCFESGDTYSFESYVLIAAAKAGHLSMVQRSLDAGVDVNRLSSCNETALTTSILSPDCSGSPGSLIPALLIENGADVNRPGAHPSALKAAIRKGKTHLITTLIRKGAHCDKSHLEEAVYLRNLDIVSALIQNGAPYHELSLVQAVQTGNLDVVLTLIRNGAHCDKLSLQEALRIHDAGRTNNAFRLDNTDIILALIQNGAPCHEVPLMEAVFTESPDVISAFIRNGAHCDGWSLHCITALSIHRRRRSIPSNFNPKPQLYTMSRIVQQSNYKTVDMFPNLLEICLDAALGESNFCVKFQTACVGHLALFTAIYQRCLEHVDVLLQKGINLSSGCVAIVLKDMCCKNLDVSLLKTLITAGVSFNIPEASKDSFCWDSPRVWATDLTLPWRQDWCDNTLQPLHILARKGHEEAVQILLDNGADPNLYGRESHSDFFETKKTVLSYAIESRHLPTVRILLKAVSDINQPALGPFGRTALETAVELGDIDIIEELLQAAADVNANPAEYGGVTALQAAAIKGYLGIATRLVDLEADVNAPAAKEEGRTALEGAAEHGRIDMVQFLLNSGADVRSPEFGAPQYNRAVAFARKNGYNAVARLLERHWRALD